MSTLHYQPGAADMCDDKRALPILGSSPVRPTVARNRSAAREWGAWISLPKKAARTRAPRGPRLDAPSPTTWFRILIERVHHGLRGRCLFCADTGHRPNALITTLTVREQPVQVIPKRKFTEALRPRLGALIGHPVL